LADQARLICLDEFQVIDIADAMLLSGLLGALFARGVVLVCTSNSPPNGLYKDGLQRERFLPAIALLEKNMQLCPLASLQDYRLRLLSDAQIYFQPLCLASEQAMESLFARMATGITRDNVSLQVNDRPILARKVAGDIAWFDFAQICEGPRAAEDYIELAREFHTIFLSNIPCFTPLQENAARRFIHLIDELYDRSVDLIVSAQAPPTALYQGEKLGVEFARTVSRLIEMQSKEYLAREHLG
jgi:cell division protein ZapE